MLTVEAIVRATRQMSAYGELGGRKPRTKAASSIAITQADLKTRTPVRVWDDARKVYVHTDGDVSRDRI